MNLFIISTSKIRAGREIKILNQIALIKPSLILIYSMESVRLALHVNNTLRPAHFISSLVSHKM